MRREVLLLLREIRFPLRSPKDVTPQPADTTFGVATEVALPVNSARSRNTEVVPKIFNDLILGDH
jgi:hypothetical protein